MSILKRLSFRRKYHQVFPLSVANIWTFDPNSVFWTLNVFFPIVDERIVVLSVWLKTFPASPLISAEGGEGLDFSNISDQSRSPLFSIPNTRGIFVFCTFWIWCFANSWQIVGKCEEAISGSQGWKMYFGQQQQQQSRLTEPAKLKSFPIISICSIKCIWQFWERKYIGSWLLIESVSAWIMRIKELFSLPPSSSSSLHHNRS